MSARKGAPGPVGITGPAAARSSTAVLPAGPNPGDHYAHCARASPAARFPERRASLNRHALRDPSLPTKCPWRRTGRTPGGWAHLRGQHRFPGHTVTGPRLPLACLALRERPLGVPERTPPSRRGHADLENVDAVMLGKGHVPPGLGFVDGTPQVRPGGDLVAGARERGGRQPRPLGSGYMEHNPATVLILGGEVKLQLPQVWVCAHRPQRGRAPRTVSPR